MEWNTAKRAVKRELDRIKRSGQARLVYAFDINRNILTYHEKVSPRGHERRRSRRRGEEEGRVLFNKFSSDRDKGERGGTDGRRKHDGKLRRACKKMMGVFFYDFRLYKIRWGQREGTKAEGKEKSRVTVGLDSGTKTPRRVRPRQRQQKNDPHTFFHLLSWGPRSLEAGGRVYGWLPRP